MERILSLKSSLEQYTAADGREEGFRQEMLRLTQTPAPMCRLQMSPGHFTASAFVLSPCMKSILLIFHEKLRMWLQPGGHVEPGDLHLVASAKRELEEETGVVNPRSFHDSANIFAIDIHEIPIHKSQPAHRHFDIRYLFVAETLAMQAASDALDARWVPRNQVENIQTDQSVLSTLEKISQMLT